jgi:hypothetical protein
MEASNKGPDFGSKYLQAMIRSRRNTDSVRFPNLSFDFPFVVELSWGVENFRPINGVMPYHFPSRLPRAVFSMDARRGEGGMQLESEAACILRSTFLSAQRIALKCALNSRKFHAKLIEEVDQEKESSVLRHGSHG